MIPSKLKVVELRAELSSRGLDTKGNKAALVERLEEALKKEDPNALEDSESAKESLTSSQQEEAENIQEAEKEEPVEEDTEQDKVEDRVKENAVEEEKKQTSSEETSGKPVPQDSPLKNQEKAHQPSEEMYSGQQNHVDRMSTDYNRNTSQVHNDQSQDKEDTKPDIEQLDGIKTEADIKKEDTRDTRDFRGADRKRKRSSERFSTTPAKVMKEDEPKIDESAVTLSWYDSDLCLIIDNISLFSACPMSAGGFGFIWAGARASYGYSQGKVCYQVKLLENCDVSHLEDEPNPNVLRVGWSTFDTSLQLGEEPNSFGYGGTGRISVNLKFQVYGKSFSVGDVVTTYLDMTGRNVVISYSVNDEYLDTAWSVPISSLNGKPLAPHILTKNIKFEVNFGQLETPWFQPHPGFAWAADVPLDQRIRGPQAPAKISDCEMIMMCGLPAAGKTVWATKFAAEHPDKMFNIIGTNALIDKMKVMGLPRKGNYHGRWDLLIEKCTQCLQKLMDIGCHRRRNFILDQTNVYPGAQRRKMRNFEGFIRKAVVIVPTDEDFKERTAKRESEEGKDVPDSAIMEMKANFTLPDKSLFHEVQYIELEEEEAQKMVEKYNKEAIDAGYIRRPPPGSNKNPNKKFRPNKGGPVGPRNNNLGFNKNNNLGFNRNNNLGFNRNRGGPRNRFNNRGRGDGGFGGGMHRDRNAGGGGGWQRGAAPDRSGWRPDNRSMGGGYRGGSGNSGGGWRGRGPSRDMMGSGGGRMGGGNRRDDGPPQRRDSRAPHPYQDRRQNQNNRTPHKQNNRGGMGQGGGGGAVAGGNWSSYQSGQQQGGWGHQQGSGGGWGHHQQQQSSQSSWGQQSGTGSWNKQQSMSTQAATQATSYQASYPQQGYQQQAYQQQGGGDGGGYNWQGYSQQAYHQQQPYWQQQQ